MEQKINCTNKPCIHNRAGKCIKEILCIGMFGDCKDMQYSCDEDEE